MGMERALEIGREGSWRQEMAFLMASNYNPIKKMQSFVQNLCVPLEPTLRPLDHAHDLDDFALESPFSLEPPFAIEEALFALEGSPGMWQLGKGEEESQEETMEVEVECGSAKRRHCALLESSRRPMFSKLQRMDRAPVKRRHC